MKKRKTFINAAFAVAMTVTLSVSSVSVYAMEMNTEVVETEEKIEEEAFPSIMTETDTVEEPTGISELDADVPVTASTIIASGSCGENVKWTLTDDGTLTISGSGAMEDFSFSLSSYIPTEDDGYRYYKDMIRKVFIDDGVTSIGLYAFQYFENLEEVRIPDSVTAIYNAAFSGCGALSEIHIPDGVERICSYVFSGCSSLNKIYIPDSVLSIGKQSFGFCSSLSEMTIPSSVLSIEAGAFRDCFSLANIYFEGNAPIFDNYVDGEEFEDPFPNVTATIYYPYGNDTWTEENMLDYGGTLTWKTEKPKEDLAIESEMTDKIYVIGSEEDVTVKCNGELKDFVSVALDGVLIDPMFYYTEEGSTVLTIFPAYLDTVELGEHTLTLNYTYSSIDTNLTVIEQNMGNTDDAENPEVDLAIVPEVTDKVYIIGSGSNAVIKCTGELKDFVSVALDSVLIDPAFYQSKEGSTVLTILSAYLDTVAVGDHTLTLNYTYGSIDTILTVIERKTENVENTDNAEKSANEIDTVKKSPVTGEDSDWILWLIVSLSGCMIFMLTKGKVKCYFKNIL